MKKTKKSRKYPDIPSSAAPVPHFEELFILRSSATNVESESEHFDFEESYVSHVHVDEEEKQPHFPNQQELDDLI